MIKLREKIFICVVIVMLIITQIPANHLIYAQSNQMFNVEIVDIDNDSKKIEVHEIKEGITKVGLFLNNKNIQTKDVSEDLSFTVYSNGTYEVKGFDANDAQKSEESIEVKSFKDLTIEKNVTTHEVKIVSRHNLTEKIVINNKDEVKTNETQVGYYVANYTIPKNGVYTFDIVNFDGKEVASRTIKYSDVPNIGKNGEIIISSEDDIKQMIHNPSDTFVLENDIELTSNLLKDVNFTGTLNGNGYMICGFTESLFNSVKDATINNVVIKGGLAKTSTNSMITNTGFYVEASDDKKDSAVILKSDNTTIKNSFAFMNVEGKNVSGFILEGTGTITHSYVSGYLKGEEVYGFGKEVNVKNSYITASVIGKTRTLFTSGNIEESFYDAQINDIEELKASPMYTKDMISKDFKNEEFKIIEGQYPEIKNIDEMKEKAQAVSTLSVQSVKTDSNLSTLKGKVETNEDSEEIEWDKEKDEISATSNDIINRFALKEARAVTSITAGASTTATKTQITYPITMGTYYKVLKANETQPALPKTHKEAIESGWKIMYWIGEYKQAGLEWNTQYTVYSTDLKTVKIDGTVTTKHGINGGKVTLTGTYDDGQEMTATLSGTNTTKGTMYFESATTLDAASWTEVAIITMDGTSNSTTYTVASALKGKYLRARFVADQTTGYQGEVIDKTATIFKEDITNVTIKNNATNGNYTLNDELVANMTPAGRENDVVFKWYHSGDVNPIATGRNYKIKASDIGKQLYVQAEAKTDGDFKGTEDSPLTSEVLPIKHPTPTTLNQLNEVSKDDITVTLTMDVTEGLYRYGYRETGTTGSMTEYPIYARNKTNTTITGLQPNKSYDFYVQQKGENGYSDSEWSTDHITITTDKEHVKGDVVVSGNTVYNKTLTASLKNNSANQTGQFVWYSLDNDGARTQLATNVTTYQLGNLDIGKKIEVAYKGTGSYAGEISTITDTISKAEIAAPTTNLTAPTKSDTSITVKMPTNTTGEKYILGISQSEKGVPIELLENNIVKEFASGASYTITGLDRDTTYYFYVRYAENALHQKSDWVESTKVVSQKTDIKAFTGNITFTYQTTNLMRGQTLTAILKPTDGASFNFKGEWKWTRIDGSNESTINNFTLTNNKQGTQYVVPSDEALDVKYKVTFTANVGYTGTVEEISTKVHDIVKEKYQKPIANDIAMEAIDDTSIKVKMDSGEGKYHFWYKKADETPWDSVKGFFNKMFVDPNDGFREVKVASDTDVDVLANTDVVISGLERNTEYIVRVQRVGDDKGTTSDFTYSTEKTSDRSVFTKKTEIAGHVTIEGTTKFGQTLTAKYNAATYASTGSGSDTQGTWQWYRGTTLIATAETYVLKQADIGQVLTVKYTMPASHSFTGQVEAKTATIQKADGISPTITDIKSQEGTDKKMTMTVTGDLGTGGTDSVYYRLQKGTNTADEPKIFPTLENPTVAGWHKVTNATMEISIDAEDKDLVANKEYTIYFVKTATATANATQLLSKTHKMGTHQQIGTITFTKLADSKQAFVVGQTVKANLSTGSNSKGTWKWYRSTTKFTGSNSAPSSTASASWKEITSGFSQTTDNRTSSLNLSEDMFGYFIRAEFVASDESGFSGSISSTESQYVRKIYDEKLTITSDTKDGNGNPKAYANTKITGTIDNYAESGVANRTTVRFNTGLGNSPIICNLSTSGTFTYTMPNNASYDGQLITAEVSKPKIPKLYVDTNLKDITATNLNSTTSTSTSMLYTAGVPISSTADLTALLKRDTSYQSGAYSDFTKKYVITTNIKMGAATIVGTDVGNTRTPFKGILDGDYHNVTGMKTTFFHELNSGAIIRNLIVNESNAKVAGSYGDEGALSIYLSSGGIASYVRGTVSIENILLSQSKLEGQSNGGGLIGYVEKTGNLTMKNCASTGVKVVNADTKTGHLFGGSIGVVAGKVTIEDSFSVNSEVIDSTGTSTIGGFLGGAYGMNYPSVTLKNVFYAGKLPVNDYTGGVVGYYKRGSVNDTRSLTNAYYDNNLISGTIVNTNASRYGTSKTTQEMIGTKLENNLGRTSWSYSEGSYPKLNWIKDHPIAKLYSATRGAFTSVDGATSSTNMFNGRISGSIQIPTELLTKDFEVISSNPSVLKVIDNGTIIPVNTGSATITITYKEPDTSIGGTASNTFDFTAISRKEEMGQVQITNSSTGTVLTNPTSPTPKMNQLLSIRHNVAEAFGPTYTWYRRKSGSTIKETISGATGKTYQVKASDVGYEISVLVSAGNFAATYSNYTKPVESITPTAPNVSNVTDGSVNITANGNSAFQYEFGYLRSDQNALITPIDGTYGYNDIVTINNLQRNKSYKFYTRIAEASDKSYLASAWSSVSNATTLKTNVTGTPNLGTAINNGAELSLTMATTNGQTGTWKLERVKDDGATWVDDISFSSSDNETKYKLTAADVGYCIRATFIGDGDFTGTTNSDLSGVIQKATSTPPSAPTFQSKSSSSITVTIRDIGKFDVAYATSASGKKEIWQSGIDNSVSDSYLVGINKLKYNTDYYIFIRKSETDENVASAWSNYTHAKTNKIYAYEPITKTGTAKVDESMTFTMPRSTVYDVDFTGTWKLERVSLSGNSEVSTTISPSKYTASNKQMTYKVDPKDAGSKLRVTYTGNGDFEDYRSTETAEIANAEQTADIDISDAVVSEIKDHSLKVQMSKGNGNDTYQFHYKTKSGLSGEIVEATVAAGTDVLIDGLSRNTEYEISVLKAAKQGYNSTYPQVIGTFKTDKSALTGTVEYVKMEGGVEKPAKVGVAEVNATYKAKYIPGKYDQTGNDTAGHWQWYADGNAIASATKDTYTIDPMTNVNEITVRFIPDSNSDFKDYRSASIGTLTKPAYEPPTILPTVTPVNEDGTIGSKLKIVSNEIDNVFYYVQKAENAKVPATILASSAGTSATTDKWFKANSSMTLNVEANTSYVVFVARLEDGSHLSSGVISHRAVKTVKDDISKITSVSIAEADATLDWKVLQDKELRIHRDNKLVDGVWQYYVSQTKDVETSWQNITAEVKVNSTEGNTSTYTYTKVNVPLKYANGYFFRAVFTGRGDLEGSEIYTSSEALIGTQLKGSAVLSTGDTSQVFVPIEAKYVYAKENGIDVVDEQNGIWTWYREETGDDIIVKKGTVGISDTYTPTVEDVNKRIYATYSGAPEGIYSGYVTSNTLSNVKRATQNRPNMPTVKQINGTSVQINLPTNMKTDGKTIAQPKITYSNEWGESGELPDGESWLHNLKANTAYNVRVHFTGTSEYEPSETTSELNFITGNQSFDEENLEINQPSILESGNKITATFSGSGYDEGYFVIKRSDGTTIQDNVQGTVTKGFLFKSSSTSIDYTITSADIGSNIIIEFKANATAPTYGGSIEKSTKEVLKPINPTKVGTPALNTVKFNETVLRVAVNDANEYVFNESAAKVSETSGDWQKLTKDTGQNYHTFTGLDKTKAYYLHVRTAETQTYRYSIEDVSFATKPYQRLQYTITYKGTDVGTTNPNPTQYYDTDGELILKDATKNGYEFKGWTTDTIKDPTKGLKIPANSTGNMTITAHWKTNEYTIDYKGGGVFATPNPTTYTVEDANFTLVNPTRDGYDFTGWTGTGITGDPQLTVTIPKGTYENKVYTANWKAKEYTITYDLKQGTNHADNPEKYTIESTTFSLKEPKRDGYDFTGWTGTGIGPTPQKEIIISQGTFENKEYTANWNINKYTATFKSNGGTPDDQTVTKNYQEALGLLPEVTRTGYTFAGWYTNNDGTGTKIETTDLMPLNGATYYAHWTINQYTVSFDSNGGNVVTATITKNYGAKLENLPTPLRTGYTFDGWFTKADSTGVEIDKNTTMPVDGATYYAHWTINQYTAKFDGNGGTDGTDIKVDYNAKLGPLPTVTRTGYTFDGWFTKADSTGVEINENTTMPVDGATYFAHWTINTYTIEYVLDKGENHVDNPENYKVTDADIELKAPSKTGHSFEGWKLNGAGELLPTVVISSGSTGHLSYTAVWKKVNYKVIFNTQDGSDISDSGADYQDKIIKPSDPTKKGYTFDGWYKESSCENEWNFDNDVIEKETTLYAKWNIINYTISYDLNDEGTNTAVNDPANKTSYTVEDKTLVLRAPSYLGYVFIGWTYGNVKMPEMEVSIPKGTVGNLSYTANWEVSDYTVTFDSKGGSQVESQGAKKNGLVAQPSDPTKKGYTFKGWYTDEDYKTVWEFEKDVVTKNRTLYAKWEIINYDIIYDLNDGGTNTAVNDPANKTSYTIEDETLVLRAPSYEEHVFIGWTYGNVVIPEMDVRIEKGTIGKHSYKANWEASDYTVSFDSRDGSKVESQGAKKNGLVAQPSDPTKKGYTFEGWYKDTSGTDIWTFESDVVSENVTLYAKWIAKEYTISIDLDGGEVAIANKEKYTIETENFTLVNPTKAGHTFIGWTGSDMTDREENVTIIKGTIGNKNYKANWSINEYSVTFSTFGGNTINKQVLKYDTLVNKPQNPNKNGYTFVGWYVDETFNKAWDFETDVVKGNMSLYAKFIENLKLVTVDKNPDNTLNKGEKVQLIAEQGASIYFTNDGSKPVINEKNLYKEAITINKEVTIKAIAVKEGYGNSSVATFNFKVIGDSTIVVDKDSPIHIVNKEDEIIEAVLSEKEYNEYLYGTDVSVRIECKEITGTLNDAIKNALDGRKVGQYLDITIYKTVGNEKEVEVTELRKKIKIVIDIPNNLYPKEGVTRIFNVIRVHGNNANLLNDLDSKENTVTIESDMFSTYLLCYKDSKENTPVVPEKPITPDVPVGGESEKPETPKDEENIEQGGTTVKPGPNGEKPFVKPDGTIDVPNGGGATVGGNDFTLPNGGTVNKDGTITIPKEGKIEINGNTIELSKGGTINKDGSISVKAGSTVMINGKKVYFEHGGTIQPNGTYKKVEKEQLNVKDFILPLWIFMYIGGSIVVFKKRKEEE